MFSKCNHSFVITPPNNPGTPSNSSSALQLPFVPKTARCGRSLRAPSDRRSRVLRSCPHQSERFLPILSFFFVLGVFTDELRWVLRSHRASRGVGRARVRTEPSPCVCSRAWEPGPGAPRLRCDVMCVRRGGPRAPPWLPSALRQLFPISQVGAFTSWGRAVRRSIALLGCGGTGVPLTWKDE